MIMYIMYVPAITYYGNVLNINVINICAVLITVLSFTRQWFWINNSNVLGISAKETPCEILELVM